MENSDNTTAALGVDGTPPMGDDFLKLVLAILEASSNDRYEHRERELAERLAYLTGKVEAIEKSLFGS